MKKSLNFFNLLEEQCRLMSKAMTLLNEYCITLNEDLADVVITIEDEADMVRRILIDELNKTFITPIDREDLFSLSRQLDEIIDYAKTSVDEIRLFKVTPNEDMIKITGVLVDMTQHINKAVRNIESHKGIAKDEAIKVKELENVVGALTQTAFATLYEGDNFNIIFKYLEIIRHLNHTADLADCAMDFLLDILVKM